MAKRGIHKVATGDGKKPLSLRQSPPLISDGTVQKELLVSLKNSDKQHFSINNFSKRNKVPRSSIYRILDRFTNIGIAEKQQIGYKITAYGINILSQMGVYTPPVATVRYPCRNLETNHYQVTNLSIHKIKFKLSFKKDKYFEEKYLPSLNPKGWRSFNLPNFKVYILYFDDATMIFKKKTIEIYVGEIAGKGFDESFLDIFSMVTKYVCDLERLELVENNLQMEKAHYARVESVLSKVLEKIDKKYRVEIAPNKYFWIDTSFNIEDETNDDLVREKIDQNFIEMFHSESTFKDIDKIIQALGIMTKLKMLETIDLNKESPKEIDKKLFDYAR